MSQAYPSLIPNDPQAEAKARREVYNQRRLRRLKIMFPFLLVLVFLVWAFTTNFIPSESMEPTLKPGDHILTMRSWIAYPWGAMPARGDIVVFILPKEAEQKEAEQTGDDTADAATQDNQQSNSFWHRPHPDILIKRVIGLPGETVQMRGNDVYINGKKLQEDYQTVPVTDPEDGYFPYAVDKPIKVPEGHLFLLGDNRNNSDDGRFWGTLPRDKVLGKFVRILWNEGANGPNEKKAEQQEKAANQDQ